MWAWGFRCWIIYVENDRHAACVPNVSACATGRSPMQTAQSVPLVQLWVTGSGADSWARSFSPSWTSGGICCRPHLRTCRIQLLPRSHACGEKVVYKVLVLWLSCVFSHLTVSQRRRRAGNVRKSLWPATNVVHTRLYGQTEHSFSRTLCTSWYGCIYIYKCS